MSLFGLKKIESRKTNHVCYGVSLKKSLLLPFYSELAWTVIFLCMFIYCRVVVVDKVTDFLLLIGKLLVVGATG